MFVTMIFLKSVRASQVLKLLCVLAGGCSRSGCLHVGQVLLWPQGIWQGCLLFTGLQEPESLLLVHVLQISGKVEKSCLLALNSSASYPSLAYLIFLLILFLMTTLKSKFCVGVKKDRAVLFRTVMSVKTQFLCCCKCCSKHRKYTIVM